MDVDKASRLEKGVGSMCKGIAYPRHSCAAWVRLSEQLRYVQDDAAGRDRCASPEILQGSKNCSGAMTHMLSLPAMLAATLTTAAHAAAGAAGAAAPILQEELLMRSCWCATARKLNPCCPQSAHLQ